MTQEDADRLTCCRIDVVTAEQELAIARANALVTLADLHAELEQP